MFRSHVDLFAVLAIAAGLTIASRIHSLPAPAIANAIQVEAPEGAVDCPLMGAVLAKISERVHSQIAAHIRADFDR
jgi:hypothetical protein